MSTRDLCQLSGLARAGLYRKPKPESEHARRVRQAIVNAALEHPAYGTRRTTHQLRRQKLTVNRKRWRASFGQRARTSCGAPISVMCD